MKLAVVDIGSNAIRFQISSVADYLGQQVVKRLEYIRFPLRLGHDVFTTGEIGAESEAKFVKLMAAYKLLIDLYEVDDYMICATSAMRESKNGEQIAQRVREEVGLKINIIDGDKEAEIIAHALNGFLDERNFVHIDVGGGSTELNLYVRKEKVASKSFKMGSVRKIENSNTADTWEEIEEWLTTKIKYIKGEIVAVGTGGNINKIFELAKEKAGTTIELTEIKKVKAMLESYTLLERKMELKLNDDRADVIMPAADIYLNVMKTVGCKKMLVPDVGLKDGMISILYQKNLAEKTVNKFKIFSNES